MAGEFESVDVGAEVGIGDQESRLEFLRDLNRGVGTIGHPGFHTEILEPSGHQIGQRDLVIDHRWAALRWPEEWFGRGLSDDDAKVVEAVFADAGAWGPGQDITNLWAGTMLAFGSDELKRTFMRRLLRDEIAMCLLYSEPVAGSDLAGILVDAVKATSNIAIDFGVTVEGIDQSGKHPLVRCGDSTFEADVVIGADGIHSVVRAHHYPD